MLNGNNIRKHNEAWIPLWWDDISTEVLVDSAPRLEQTGDGSVFLSVCYFIDRCCFSGVPSISVVETGSRNHQSHLEEYVLGIIQY
jgi:hypothetical protein